LLGYTEDEHAVRGLPGRRDRRRAVTSPVAARLPESAAGVPDSAPVGVWDRWVDRFAGSDPGLNRFRLALQAVLTIGLAIAVEGLFVHFTHALQIQTHGAALPTALAAKVAAANHGFLVIAISMGSIIGLISSVGVIDNTARDQLVTMLFLPLPLIAALAFGLAIGGYRIPGLVCLPVILAIGTYGRRFGPRGAIAGTLLFPGYLLAFLAHRALKLGDLGWLAAEVGVGVAVAIAVRFAFFYPRQARALGRTQRSYMARARKVAALALEPLENPGHSAPDAAGSPPRPASARTDRCPWPPAAAPCPGWIGP
jgi:hypothetical protein